MPQSPLIHRVLRSSGYAITALLVLAAAGVLLWPLMDGGTPSAAGPVPSATAAQPAASAPGGSGEQGENPFTVLDPGRPGQGRQEPQGNGPCGTKKAYYERVGSGIEVTVVYAGFGAVRAIVVPIDGEPVAQSYTTSGDPTPHVFKFEDVPAQAIKKVGLTVTGGSGARECELQRR